VTTLAGQATTSSTGAFSYPVKAGASRQITLVYVGFADQRGTSAAFLARYIGKTTVHAEAKLVVVLGQVFEHAHLDLLGLRADLCLGLGESGHEPE
jgi:hypothetical protein